MNKISELAVCFLLTKFCNKKMTEEFIIAGKTRGEKGSIVESQVYHTGGYRDIGNVHL